MEWVLIFSLQWVVNGTPTAPTTTVNVGYESEEHCTAALKALEYEMGYSVDDKLFGENMTMQRLPEAGVETKLRAVCVQRKGELVELPQP
jgi:hypothetical protein